MAGNTPRGSTASASGFRVDISQIEEMSNGDIIKNFGLMQDQVTAVQKQLADAIVPVVDRVNLNEVSQKEEFQKAMDNLAGLESRLQKSVNPIIQG